MRLRARRLGLLALALVGLLPSCQADGARTAENAKAAGAIPSAGGAPGSPPVAVAAWNWNGIIGTGQSLSVGTMPIVSTSQPYRNLMLSLGPAGNAAVPPWDPALATLSMVPLIETVRPIVQGWPRPYPDNIFGETPHAAMANEITWQVKAAWPNRDYVTVHSVVGESGQGIAALAKQGGSTQEKTGRAYAAALFEAAAITRLAHAAGQTYGVAAIVMTHGETDAGNESYGNDLLQLLADSNADLRAITGQAQRIPMYLSQQHAYPNGPESAYQRPAANQFQWQLGVTHPGEFVCIGPKYQYPGSPDGVHLSTVGYELYGEKVGEVYFERAVLGRDWQPLAPTKVTRLAGTLGGTGRILSVAFHVPVPPLRWDASLGDAVLREWTRGKGFELRTRSENIPIESVALVGDTVQIAADRDLPARGLVIGYALSSQGVQMEHGSRAVRWGQLRDSDPFLGCTTHLPNPNYAVSFELPVPDAPAPSRTATLPVPRSAPWLDKPIHGRVMPLDWAGFAGAVTYTFDDSQPSHLEHYDELASIGAPMTFYISTGVRDEPGYDATWARAVRDGNELGNHTVHHCHADLTSCSFGAPLPNVLAEFDGCNETIESQYGQRDVWTGASPFGDTGYAAAAAERFLVYRGVRDGMVMPNDRSDPFDLPCHVLQTDESAASLDAYIDKARKTGGWQCFVVHTIRPTKAIWYNPVDLSALRASIEHAEASRDVWIDTEANIAAYWVGQRIFSAAVPSISSQGSRIIWRWTWTLPPHFPRGKYLRVVGFGTLLQNGVKLEPVAPGAYDIALDAGSLSAEETVRPL
jgi:hypothetical protein